MGQPGGPGKEHSHTSSREGGLLKGPGISQDPGREVLQPHGHGLGKLAIMDSPADRSCPVTAVLWAPVLCPTVPHPEADL